MSDSTKRYDPKVKLISTGDAGIERLSISLDYDDDPNITHPVMIYVPDVAEFEHHHIQLTDEEAMTMWTWLGEYFKSKQEKTNG